MAEKELQANVAPPPIWRKLVYLYLLVVIGQAVFRFPFGLIANEVHEIKFYTGTYSADEISNYLYIVFNFTIYVLGALFSLIMSRRLPLGKDLFLKHSALPPAICHISTIIFYLVYYIIVMRMENIDTMKIDHVHQQSLAIFCVGLVTVQWIMLPVMMKAESKIKDV